MEKTKILSQINDIFIEALDNQNITLTYESSANDVDGWDSLSNIYIIVEIEKLFNVRFSTQELQIWKNVGDIIKSIQNKNE